MQVVFIGPPGSGKGTQCRLLIEHLTAIHIATDNKGNGSALTKLHSCLFTDT